MPLTQFDVAGRRIGADAPIFLIAEVGINHSGDPDLALRMIEAAAKAGADAVKLQTFETERFLSRSSRYFDTLRACELPREVIPRLRQRARDLGVLLFSSCFDEPSANFWHELDAPLFKIASGDITHLPLLRHIAGFGKPMVVSTGGATLEEIDAACRAIRRVSAELPVALLHCVSNYPAEPRDANLACMAAMRARFGCPVGFSDHTVDNTTAIAAAALGAEVIERHFTLDRALDGPDHALSSDPNQLAELARALKTARLAVGKPTKAPIEATDQVQQIRRSVTAAIDIPAGTGITREMLAIKRPGTGIHPNEIESVIGCQTHRGIQADQTLTWNDLSAP